jgi:GGDEF domain-containing protein
MISLKFKHNYVSLKKSIPPALAAIFMTLQAVQIASTFLTISVYIGRMENWRTRQEVDLVLLIDRDGNVLWTSDAAFGGSNNSRPGPLAKGRFARILAPDRQATFMPGDTSRVRFFSVDGGITSRSVAAESGGSKAGSTIAKGIPVIDPNDGRIGEWAIVMRSAVRTTMRGLAATDGLTGLPNRRKLDEFMSKIRSGCSRQSGERRSKESLSPWFAAAIIDVDFFKRYNDAYGHQAGDNALRLVAGAIAKSVCRTGDLV